MSNHHLRNKELTLKAKGLLSQINKNERTLFPRFVVVGFLYSFCSSRQDFQIFFAHTVKHSIELTAARGFLLFPFREKELVY